MVRRIVLAMVLAVVAFAAAAQATPANAQAPVVWVRGYPQFFGDGCLYYVAAWSDGSYTWTAWQCPPGVAPVRGNTRAVAVNRYPQNSLSNPGCIEYVTQWADGTFTWVPYACAPGVPYFKPGTTAVVPTVLVVPVAPVAPQPVIVGPGPSPFIPRQGGLPPGGRGFQPYRPY